MTIHVNGRERSLPSKYKQLSYDEAVILAYGPLGESVYTVTYRFRAGKETGSGSLAQGAAVKLRRGMIFNVIQTNKA